MEEEEDGRPLPLLPRPLPPAVAAMSASSSSSSSQQGSVAEVSTASSTADAGRTNARALPKLKFEGEGFTRSPVTAAPRFRTFATARSGAGVAYTGTPRSVSSTTAGCCVPISRSSAAEHSRRPAPESGLGRLTMDHSSHAASATTPASWPLNVK